MFTKFGRAFLAVTITTLALFVFMLGVRPNNAVAQGVRVVDFSIVVEPQYVSASISETRRLTLTTTNQGTQQELSSTWLDMPTGFSATPSNPICIRPGPSNSWLCQERIRPAESEQYVFDVIGTNAVQAAQLFGVVDVPGDINLDNNWSISFWSITVPPTPSNSDLAITKTGPSLLLPGTTSNFTITWSNTSGLVNNVVITDQLPTSWFVSQLPTGCSMNMASWQMVCSIGTISGSTNGQFSYWMWPNDSWHIGSTITNTAVIKGVVNNDPITGNNSSSWATHVDYLPPTPTPSPMPSPTPSPTPTSTPTPPPVPIDCWTVGIYLSADNNLDYYAVVNMDWMKTAASAGGHWYALVDRASTGDSLVQITPSGIQTLEVYSSELNMGAESTLENFLVWLGQKEPLCRIAVDIWGHGSGWRKNQAIQLLDSFGHPLWRQVQGERGVAYDDHPYGSYLTTAEQHQAFVNAQTRLGRKFDQVWYDACVMADLELAYELAPGAKLLVASRDYVPGYGLPYDRLLITPQMANEDVGRLVVESYRLEYGLQLTAFSLERLDQVTQALDEFTAAAIFSPTTYVTAWQGASVYYGDGRDLVEFAQAAGATNLAATIMSQTVAHNGSWISVYFPGPNYPSGYDTGYNALAISSQTSWDRWLKVWTGVLAPPPWSTADVSLYGPPTTVAYAGQVFTVPVSFGNYGPADVLSATISFRLPSVVTGSLMVTHFVGTMSEGTRREYIGEFMLKPGIPIGYYPIEILINSELSDPVPNNNGYHQHIVVMERMFLPIIRN